MAAAAGVAALSELAHREIVLTSRRVLGEP